MKRRHGWRRDHDDHRDIAYVAPQPGRSMPARCDLSVRFPLPFDQGVYASCTAHAVLAACQYRDARVGADAIRCPSRFFVYYNARRLEGATRQDDGATLRDTLKAVNRWGYPDEALWPYTAANLHRKPSERAFRAAAIARPVGYHAVERDRTCLKLSLLDDCPVAFGFQLRSDFLDDRLARTGVLNEADKHEPAIGGQAGLLVGWDDGRNKWLVRNSYGPTWGHGGYFWMPYAYTDDSDLSDDFWSIRAAP
jgi:C1A family cysteine protease